MGGLLGKRKNSRAEEVWRQDSQFENRLARQPHPESWGGVTSYNLLDLQDIKHVSSGSFLITCNRAGWSEDHWWITIVFIRFCQQQHFYKSHVTSYSGPVQTPYFSCGRKPLNCSSEDVTFQSPFFYLCSVLEFQYFQCRARSQPGSYRVKISIQRREGKLVLFCSPVSQYSVLCINIHGYQTLLCALIVCNYR